VQLRISVVVPSYNQGRFLGAALESLLRQDYPELEILLMDGGSCDETKSVIERYRHRLTFWRSHPDLGQAAAINEGFTRATGDVFCWLNSDDLQMAGTLSVVNERLRAYAQKPVVLYGGCEVFREGSRWREIRSAVPFDFRRLQITDFIDQPSAYWTRSAWQLVGPLDATLRYAFDWDWFLRAGRICDFIPFDGCLSRYRVHADHKSKIGGRERWREMVDVVRRHSPADIQRHYDFLSRHAVAHAVLNGRMRAALALRKVLPMSTSEFLATALMPPFWLLPAGIYRHTLWEISGIR
jgi:glycosyltransferase involved in cell wall biosynthesis